MCIKVFSLGVFALILHATSASTIEAPSDYENRIWNGQSAKEGEFRYQVSIGNCQNHHHCGGSIINRKWILTAAHCVVNTCPCSLTVYIGSVHLSSKKAISYNVTNIISHENYTLSESNGDLVNIHDDIALIELEKKIEKRYFKNKIVETIKLETNLVKDVKCVISGWGILENNTYPDTLQYIKTKTLINADCDQIFDKYLVGNRLYSKQICTLVPTKSISGGDSGGPLVANGKQIGIASWVPDSLIENNLNVNVYTRVAPYIDWIYGKINKK